MGIQESREVLDAELNLHLGNLGSKKFSSDKRWRDDHA